MKLERLDPVIDAMLRAARIPGAAVAIVSGGELIFSKGCGYRDREAQLPMDPDTVYPIASTTKAMNATLIGMLVDEGKLAWDAPVQNYLPGFRLHDPWTSSQVTLRDLITMRTGLPRHDWLWKANPISRAELIRRLGFLDLSAGFRERFQYSNLTGTTAGHVMEVVTGQSWEELARERLFEPLQMTSTGFAPSGNATLSYHENARRELLPTRRLASEVTAPSGGAVHSTVKDMARWMAFNLAGGTVGNHSLIKTATLAEIHAPQVIVGADPSGPTPDARYALGWFVDVYNGCDRLSHGGYLHDVNSEIMLFPKEGIGIVSFTNFGPPTLARLLSQHAFDLALGFSSVQTLEDALAQYEKKVADLAHRASAMRRVPGTSPSHDLGDYVGAYMHAGYGTFHIDHRNGGLSLRRNELALPLEHWHYDVWLAMENDLFPTHKPQPFDRASRILFESSADGHIGSFCLQLEPAVSPVRFVKQQVPAR